MFLTPLDRCFRIPIKPGGICECVCIAALVLAAGMVLPVKAGSATRDGFDKLRQAPRVEFLDGNALDLLVGGRKGTPAIDEADVGEKGTSEEPTGGKALADLLVDGQGDFDLESVAWNDAEGDPAGGDLAGGDPAKGGGASRDDLDTAEDTLNLEDFDLPSAEQSEQSEQSEPGGPAPAGRGAKNGG